jgi:hypothetical protein
MIALVGIAMCFYYAQTSSTRLTGDITGHSCEQYEWCFDCVQDENCGYCKVNSVPFCAAAMTGSDDNDKISSNTTTCPSSNFEGNTCPGATTANAGWLIFASMCFYLLAFSPGRKYCF